MVFALTVDDGERESDFDEVITIPLVVPANQAV
jgi:hypothetical protein